MNKQNQAVVYGIFLVFLLSNKIYIIIKDFKYLNEDRIPCEGFDGKDFGKTYERQIIEKHQDYVDKIFNKTDDAPIVPILGYEVAES